MNINETSKPSKDVQECSNEFDPMFELLSYIIRKLEFILIIEWNSFMTILQYANVINKFNFTTPE